MFFAEETLIRLGHTDWINNKESKTFGLRTRFGIWRIRELLKENGLLKNIIATNYKLLEYLKYDGKLVYNKEQIRMKR